jgi:hypothetical protein
VRGNRCECGQKERLVPIIYIHGVAVRSIEMPMRVETYLRRYIAPVLSNEPETVPFLYVPWGSEAASFAWNGASRPPSPLLRLGGGEAPTPLFAVEHAESLVDVLEPAALLGGLTTGQVGELGRGRLKELSVDELSDAAAMLLVSTDDDVALITIAADDVAHDARVRTELAHAATPQEEAEIFQRELLTRYRANLEARGLAAQGSGLSMRAASLADRIQEALGRLAGKPTYLLSRAIGELRRPLNAFITMFLGDVFTYLARERGMSDAPGPITTRLLDTLRAARAAQQERNGEAIILLSHSMGGQISYDVLSHHLRRDEYAGIRVDFWCATASQVALFEELKLFRASDPQFNAKTTRVPPPGPAQLGVWWNVWDYNDFLSYTAASIFEPIDDESFNSGASLLTAHSAYLQRPSFYRRFATKLQAAQANGWRPA